MPGPDDFRATPKVDDVSGQSEDDVWRSIVENYGDRPEVDPLPPAPAPEGRWFAPDDDLPDEDLLDDEPAYDDFVPPEPPPVPHPPPVRLAAWSGLFGAPAVLLIALLLRVSLPSWAGYALVGSFVGGFAYLVVHMQRGPRDPGDDGAVL